MADPFSSFDHPDYAEIVVIRHGETAWNADGRIQGHLDVELNEVGRAQAASVVKDPDLRERHLGDLQGISRREAAKTNPTAYRAMDRGQEIPGGGESLDQLSKRCTSALQRIGMKYLGKRVVVVTHGGVIRSLYKRANNKNKRCGMILNTSVNVFHLYEDKWIIKTWGDVSHLSQTGFLQSGFGGDRTSG
ncbi:phosphoglycerate mutase-like protein 4 isoform X2 [Neltuma alba]|uniref:phosphoglycerate mutase-like protein 4 isoform X2 n=1 Tax=Neltuma alba TaxID=207710 RepID=UPI0010A38AA8|nr:phosphoglycerate mutase-like protein 4 isoform X2 [Prosopis alba]